MFLYDDKDYLTLMDDPEVNLDSPQADRGLYRRRQGQPAGNPAGRGRDQPGLERRGRCLQNFPPPNTAGCATA